MKYILTLFLMIITVYHSKSEEHPIDVKLEECRENRFDNNTFPGECYFDAEEAWDKELNKIYQQLKKKMSKDIFKELKNTQLKWIQFKEKEFSFWSSFYESEIDKGTLRQAVFAPNMAYLKYNLTKTRTLELQDVLDIINN
jgi:uncharacterized protein YecT (DUF1311 family)